jgi:hypothetical protein
MHKLEYVCNTFRDDSMRRTLCENSNVMILHGETGLQLLGNTVDYWPLTRLQFGVDDYRSGGNGFAKKKMRQFFYFHIYNAGF